MIKMPRYTDEIPVAILADGNYPSGEMAVHILSSAARVVCCDGAAMNYMEREGIPAAIVGDCDSLPAKIRGKYGHIIHCDADQESNDLTKAVRYCLANGMGDIVILGATGKREDHTLGNIGLLPGYYAHEGMERIRMVTDYGIFEVIDSDARFESFEGQQVSIFCPDRSVRITTRNLLYPLHEANLTAWWQGTLNQSLGDTFGIGTTGIAVIFRVFNG